MCTGISRAVAAGSLVLALLCLGGSPMALGQEASPPEASVPTAPVRLGSSLEGALDADLYVLGPGDVLRIGLWGDVNRQEPATVNPDGAVLISPVGPIRVAGITLAEARALIKGVMSQYYRPDILSVSLISLRTFEVHVVGMVKEPGAVEVNGVTRVSQAVAMAEGIVGGGSMRNILVRRGADTLRADLTSYINLGDNALNPFLRDGDAVYVPPVTGWTDVFGSVGRPGRYEFVDGETIADLLRLAGGLRPEAYTDKIEVERFDPQEGHVSEPILLDAEPALLQSFEMQLGDRVFVRSIPGWHEDAKVEIVGEVRFPGLYVIDEGAETLSEVIARAGGFTENASLAEARLVRNSYAEETHPIERELAALDGMQDAFDKKERDLLKTMGREVKGRVAVRFEDVFLEHDRSEDVLVFDGDVIEIPRASNLIRVAGQVKNPGLVPIAEGRDYSYYIKMAGGFAPMADRGGTTLIRAASGVRVDPWGEDIGPGDIIWVPERAERDWWQVAKDVLSVAAQMATIWLVVDAARGK
jgi:polysaccharide export outer membrane protein